MKHHFITLFMSTCGTILGLCIFATITGKAPFLESQPQDAEPTGNEITSTTQMGEDAEPATKPAERPKKYYYIDRSGDIHASRECWKVVGAGAKRVTNQEPLEYKYVCYECVSEEEHDEIEALTKK